MRLEEANSANLNSNAPRGAEVILTNVERAFAEKQVVSRLSLQVKPGEFISLLGPSGCGKSTLLRMIAGLDKPDRGQITINSFGKKFYRAFVFQEAALLPWRTVIENAALPLELMGVKKADALSRARTELLKVGLSDALDVFPNQLSGGMKMRASVARAMVVEPSLLLLDEPFAALDEHTRHRLQEDLRKLWEANGMTTIFVTHSVNEAVFLSNRAIVLSSRPANLVTDQILDLPRERNRNLRSNLKFVEQVELISQAFERGIAK